jgi:hypothetical protein
VTIRQLTPLWWLTGCSCEKNARAKPRIFQQAANCSFFFQFTDFFDL